MDTADVSYLRHRAQVTAMLQVACGLLVTLSLLLPGALAVSSYVWVAFTVLAVACWVMSALGLLRRDRFGPVEFLVAVCVADLAVAFSAYVQPGGNLLVLLVMPTLLAGVFASRLLLAVQVGVVGVLTVLVELGGGVGVLGSVVQVLVEVTSIAMVGLVVVALREHVVAALDENRRLSRTDPLTGLANRHGLEERVPGMWNAATRRKEALAVLLLDVDHFAALNEEHGHVKGDRVLLELADLVRARVRSEDVVARFGSGQLVVIAAEPSATRVTETGRRLRRSVEDANLTVPLTVSIGSIRYLPSDLDDPVPTFEALLEDADRALHDAKRAGRNRVVSRTAGDIVIPLPRPKAG